MRLATDADCDSGKRFARCAATLRTANAAAAAATRLVRVPRTQAQQATAANLLRRSRRPSRGTMAPMITIMIIVMAAAECRSGRRQRAQKVCPKRDRQRQRQRSLGQSVAVCRRNVRACKLQLCARCAAFATLAPPERPANEWARNNRLNVVALMSFESVRRRRRASHTKRQTRS